MSHAPLGGVNASSLLLVYGSLKRGEVNYPVLLEAGACYVGEASTSEAFPLEEGPRWRRLLDRPGAGKAVRGELFRVESEAGWALLDAFEGHPHGYRRRLVNVIDAAHQIRSAWVYFFVCE